MRLTILGSGTSGGVPVLGCNCKVCMSKNPKDRRLRCAALLETDDTRILIDCGPDIREQLLTQRFIPIDALLLTHIHYDHVGGIDDLRPMCAFGDIDVYADKHTTQGLKTTMPDCFTETLYPGVPRLVLHDIEPHRPVRIGDVEIMPVTVMHDKLPIMGYRIGKLAYITDMKTISDDELQYLEGVDTLVVNALRWKREHHSHQLVEDAVKFSKRVGAKRTYLTHLTHRIGLHENACRQLPEGFTFAYDGLIIEI